MHYVMKCDFGLTNQFVFFRKEAQGWDASAWRTGEPLKAPPPPIELIADGEEPTAFSDLLLAKNGLHAYSGKLRSTLQRAGVDNIEYAPIKVIDASHGTSSDDYRIANILGLVACLDDDNSVVKKLANGKGNRVVKEFALLEDRITPLPGRTEPPRLFRLAEFSYHVIAHESIKTACEVAGITGVEFIRTQDFV